MKRFNAVSLIAAVFLLTSVTAYGDTLSTWVGFNSPTPVWSHPENWSPPVVPNNSPGTGYDARNVNAEVDISPTVNSLTAAQLWGPPSGPAPILTVINDATVTGGLLFAPGFGSPFFPGPTGPASLSVGGDLNLMGSATIVNGSLKVKGNFTISSPFSSPSPFTALYPLNNNDEFRVGGTLTNQAGNLLLGNGRCFGPFQSCPAVVYPAPIPLGVSGPPTSVGALVNNGQITVGQTFTPQQSQIMEPFRSSRAHSM